MLLGVLIAGTLILLGRGKLADLFPPDFRTTASIALGAAFGILFTRRAVAVWWPRLADGPLHLAATSRVASGTWSAARIVLQLSLIFVLAEIVTAPRWVHVASDACAFFSAAAVGSAGTALLSAALAAGLRDSGRFRVAVPPRPPWSPARESPKCPVWLSLVAAKLRQPARSWGTLWTFAALMAGAPVLGRLAEQNGSPYGPVIQGALVLIAGLVISGSDQSLISFLAKQPLSIAQLWAITVGPRLGLYVSAVVVTALFGHSSGQPYEELLMVGAVIVTALFATDHFLHCMTRGRNAADVHASLDIALFVVFAGSTGPFAIVIVMLRYYFLVRHVRRQRWNET